MKLIKLANSLHTITSLRVIRHLLFFHTGDTVDDYQLEENERYLRERPFLEDARIFITGTSPDGDSVDLMVVTKDLFEFGGDIPELDAKSAKFDLFDKNLVGTGQSLSTGFLWKDPYHPPWNAQVIYNDYNLWGTFTDFTMGYSSYNEHSALDTGVYETSYFAGISRPLYSSRSRFTGGLSLSVNYSNNLSDLPDSLFRDYQYSILDYWSGFQISKNLDQYGTTGSRPNLAILFRQYNLHFTRQPTQEQFKSDPTYNNHNFILSQFVCYKKDYFKANRFFGFGRTEDIPLGYTLTLSLGHENFVGFRRWYSALEFDKYWRTLHLGFWETQAGLSSFWYHSLSEDAVLHFDLNYYSPLYKVAWGYLRNYFSLDILSDPNSYLYKPLNINRGNGIEDFYNLSINGYQRVNINFQSIYFSPFKIYGFKFNFFGSIQGTHLSRMVSKEANNLIYTDLGVGCLIRNENLAFQTLKIGLNYLPDPPQGIRPLIFELSAISDFRFNIFALKEPSFIPFR